MEKQSECQDGLIFCLGKEFGKALTRRVSCLAQIADTVECHERVLVDRVQMIWVVCR